MFFTFLAFLACITVYLLPASSSSVRSVCLELYANMSWLSPKRRRTTGNLKAQATNGVVSLPTDIAEDTNGTGSDSVNDLDEVPELLPPVPTTPTSARPPSRHLTAASPQASAGATTNADSNLFYAFARAAKGGGGSAQDVLGSLLGGSAPALASVEAAEAKKEAKKAREKVDRMEERLEKLMGMVERTAESVSGLVEQQKQQSRDSGERAKNVPVAQDDTTQTSYYPSNGNEFGELTDHMASIKELLARNCEHVESLATRQAENEKSLRDAIATNQQKDDTKALDMQHLSSHLDRVQGLLEQTAQAQAEAFKDTKVPDLVSQPPALDFTPLTDAFTAVQASIESNSSLMRSLLDEGTGANDDEIDRTDDTLTQMVSRGRRPSTPFWGRDAPPPPAIDLTPLTDLLSGVKDAIEQQNASMQALVGFATGGGGDDGGDADGRAATTPGVSEKRLGTWGEGLELIYAAIEEGNKFTKEKIVPALIGSSLDERLGELIKVVEDGNSFARASAEKTPPLAGDRLAQLLAAMEESNALARAGAENPVHVDLTSLERGLDKLHTTTDAARETAEKTREESAPLPAQLARLCSALESTSDRPPKLDLQPLERWMEQVHEAVMAGNESALAVAEREPDTAVKTELEKLHRTLEAGNAHAKELAARTIDIPQIDLKPLSARLDQLKDVIEANGAKSAPSIDFAPLKEHLDLLHETIKTGNQQSQEQHQKQIASKAPQLDLAPLTTHLEALRRSAADNNRHLKSLVESQSKRDLWPLEQQLDSVSGYLQQILEVHTLAQEGSQGSMVIVKEKLGGVSEGLKAVLERLEGVQGAIEGAGKAVEKRVESVKAAVNRAADEAKTSTDGTRGSSNLSNSDQPPPTIDFTPLLEKLESLDEHLSSLREWSEFDSEQLKELVDAHKSNRDLDLTPLTTHLAALRATTEQNNFTLQQLFEAQHSSPTLPSPPVPPEIDFSPLTERLSKIHESLEAQAAQHLEITRSQSRSGDERDRSPGIGDAKFVMSALTSHLSRIQAVTEANARHVLALRGKVDAESRERGTSVDSGEVAIRRAVDASASELSTAIQVELRRAEQSVVQALQAIGPQVAMQVRAIGKALQEGQRESTGLHRDAVKLQGQILAAQKDVVSGQKVLAGGLGEALEGQKTLIAGQAEGITAIREMSKCLAASRELGAGASGAMKEAGVVVLPPPRKMGRRIVGYVYDGNDSGGSQGSRKGTPVPGV